MKNERAPAASFDPAGRIAGLLGMARRAGKLTAGFDAVAALIGRGKAAAVMTAADLSEKTNKEL
ncbi:MAG TPA: 50S ribosomal protein L7ae, partial [Firmicutes bacterium]|nr:50S ribosomal protein L7ae [Bacillota bacterium]